MTDQNNVAETPVAPQFSLQRIYLKDVSFETPMGVEAFRQQGQPKISQDLNTAANRIDDEHFEVILKLTVNVSIADKVAFLIEVQQAGLFHAVGIEAAQLTQLMNTACPQILFPYAREVIDNLALKGSFPALALPPINFDALYAHAVAQAEEQAANGATN